MQQTEVPEQVDDLLWVVESMFGGSTDSVIVESPPLCDHDIEVCLRETVPVGSCTRLTCDHGWVTVEGDPQPWTEIERLTLAVPGVSGLCHRAIRPVVRPRRPGV